MELDLSRSPPPSPFSHSMMFDELSMERNKSFVKALQELKSLRPQFYYAAEYCRNSYLRSEQKQMVLDNLKDYAVRALVNAVDQLGTVSYKLTDLIDQQALDVSTMDLKITCVKQLCMHQISCKKYILWFPILGDEGAANMKSSGAQHRVTYRVPGSEPYVAGHRDVVDGYRPLAAARLFENPNEQIPKEQSA